MRPLKLTLTGFTGIRSGLGLDTLTLDLDAQDAALVALIGPNGCGKSTVIDNLHPYRLMPSRAGGYSPGSFSFYDQVGPEAEKELIWTNAGQVYRSHLVFKTTARTKKTDAYLFAQSGSSWLPASSTDGTVSDGKAETYDRLVESILGSPAMFFTSAFSAQNRRGLSSYANGEIKALLSELLGLDDLREIGVKSSDEAKAQRMRLDAMRGELARLDECESEAVQAEEGLTEAKLSIEQSQQDRRTAQATVNTASKRLADLLAELSGNTETEARRANLLARLQRLQDATSKARSDAIEHAQRICAARESASYTLDAEISGLSRQIESAQNQLRLTQSTAARAGEVQTARQAEPAAREALEAARQSLAQEQQREGRAKDLRAAAQLEQQRLEAITRDGRRLAEACTGIRQRAGLIEQVPCHGSDLAGACPLLQNAREAHKDAPAAEAKAEAAREEYKQVAAVLSRHRSDLDEVGSAEVAKAEGALRAAEAEVRKIEAALALAPAIEQAEAVIAGTQANLVAWAEQITLKRDASVRLQTEHEAAIRAIGNTEAEALSSIERDRLDTQAELDALPPPADTTALAAAKIALEGAERTLYQIEQSIAALNTRAGALTERIASNRHALAKAAETRAEAATLEQDISEWSLLAKAFGNDGIIALCIDDAGPSLSGYANDLLLTCYGPRFSVSIRTQSETAKGDLKEIFDIIVYDGERGNEKSVRDMSGGEKIWINEALTRAIALYQSHAHDRHYECLFADESDGALDLERKQQFMRMKRRVLELGGYRSEIFISHTPELWEMADRVIDLEEYRV